MKVLVACEESQAVCAAFRSKGHEAYSCDLLECSGGYPEYHIMNDVLPLLNGNCEFTTMDGISHKINDRWDLILAFPVCTYLTVTGNRWFNIDKYGDKALDRMHKRSQAIEFFMKFANADCDKIAIENPIGVMSSVWRKPDQIIHPYMFGDPERKATCLWLKNLECLVPTNIVEPQIIYYKNGKGSDSPWHVNTINMNPVDRARFRSKTFPGIASAMADQWG